MKISLAVASLLLVQTLGAAPPQVVKVFPGGGSALARVEAIGAELDFTKGQESDPASLQLFVDGVDVTRRSRMTLTDDWPPSSVRISYTPILLESGEHWAEIRFHTRERRTISYVWGFIFTPGRSEGRIRLVWGTWSSDR
jgi:hypothetical protein